jgi:hypothetical protein
MSVVVESLTKQLKEMVLSKVDMQVELHDLEESIKVFTNLIAVLKERNVVKEEPVKNMFGTEMYIE